MVVLYLVHLQTVHLLYLCVCVHVPNQSYSISNKSRCLFVHIPVFATSQQQEYSRFHYNPTTANQLTDKCKQFTLESISSVVIVTNRFSDRTKQNPSQNGKNIGKYHTHTHTHTHTAGCDVLKGTAVCPKSIVCCPFFEECHEDVFDETSVSSQCLSLSLSRCRGEGDMPQEYTCCPRRCNVANCWWLISPVVLSSEGSSVFGQQCLGYRFTSAAIGHKINKRWRSNCASWCTGLCRGYSR